MKQQRHITVCDSCLRSSCWQGIFMCENAVSAGLVNKTEAELVRLGLEDPSWFLAGGRQ